MSQVKLGELGQWFGRRNKHPKALVGAVSRAYWRWNHKYCLSKRTGIAPYFQLITAGVIFFYAINYGRISKYFYFDEFFRFLKIYKMAKINQTKMCTFFFYFPLTAQHRNYKYH